MKLNKKSFAFTPVLAASLLAASALGATAVTTGAETTSGNIALADYAVPFYPEMIGKFSIENSAGEEPTLIAEQETVNGHDKINETVTPEEIVTASHPTGSFSLAFSADSKVSYKVSVMRFNTVDGKPVEISTEKCAERDGASATGCSIVKDKKGNLYIEQFATDKTGVVVAVTYNDLRKGVNTSGTMAWVL